MALSALAVVDLAPGARADTAVGDGGHYLRYAPKVYFYNSDGRAFSVTIHLMRWPVASWNPREVTLRLTDPQGRAVVDGTVPFEGTSRSWEIPRGPRGPYLLEMNLPARHVFRGPDFWVESSLDRSVVFAGHPHVPDRVGNALVGRWLVVQCSVPRRWWFWVPSGTKSFVVRTQWIQNYQSQREDWGITVFSPRGQRVRMLWGDLDFDRGRPFDTPTSRTAQAVVNVEPGTAGRFWSAELRLGDSHNYSKISFSLEGVPPYVARSPEEWFDPASPTAVPPLPFYDETAFMQFARDERTREEWSWLQHFSPCPSLGDPDGTQIRGEAAFAVWNPEDRPLRLRVGTYLPRTATPAGEKARVFVTGAKGETLLDREVRLDHLHGDDGTPEPLPRTGAGVTTVRVEGAERWFAFTYPATPLVWIGRPAGDGWSRFEFEVGTARHWYFAVPKGTRSFAVRASVRHATDRLWLEANAPDRTMALLYGRSGEIGVEVPPGLDGKIWHFRTDIGSGTVMYTDGGPESRYLGIYATVDVRGIPALLAPTWEQWFDPSRPGERP